MSAVSKEGIKDKKYSFGMEVKHLAEQFSGVSYTASLSIVAHALIQA